MASTDSDKLVAVLWRGQVMAGFRTCFVALAVLLVAMIIIWQPWVPKIAGAGRSISVTGTATITAAPDQYVFSPSYDFTSSTKQTALANLSTKSDQIVGKLKALGVANKDIKTNASGYTDYGYYQPVYDGNNTYTLSLTVTVTDQKLAQKVQDYLVTTSPTGEVTPNVSFSTAKQRELQNQARTKAEADARSQADQSAANLGFSVGAVKSVTDNNSNNFPIFYNGVASAAGDMATPKSLSLQPGQNDLSYSVTVVYFIQ